MARYLPYNYNQSMLLPVTLKDHIYPGSLEETIDIMVEKKLDLTLFDQLYHNDDTGRLAYHPKVLFKVILLAYSRGIIGSRRIEKTCRENILFLALSGGQQPDHSPLPRSLLPCTITSSISSHRCSWSAVSSIF